MNEHEFETPAELREFERELAKFRPKTPAVMPLELHANAKPSTAISLASRLATLAAGLLIGAIIGGAVVYFSLRPDSPETIIVQIAPEPARTAVTEIPQQPPTAPTRVQSEDFAEIAVNTGNSDEGPSEKIDLLIAAMSERSMRLAFASSRMNSQAARYRSPDPTLEPLRRPRDVIDELLLQ